MTESDFSVTIQINFHGSIWNFWEQNFSRELEEAWAELERLRIRPENFPASETYRRELFLEQKQKIRNLWTVTSIWIKDQLNTEVANALHEHRAPPTVLREFNRNIYYSAILNWCRQFFYKKYGYDVIASFQDFKREFELQVYNTDAQQRDEIIEDGVLEELWNRFGSHKLQKVKFVYQTPDEN